MVKDIIKLCAELLDNENLIAYLNENNPSDVITAEKDVETLIKCFNIVTDEISREYYPLITTEKFTANNGVLTFENFTKNPVYIRKITKTDGSAIDYKVLPIKIYVEGEVLVEYAYSCPEVTINDVCEYEKSKISKYILAYGTVVEYCLIKGMFEEAVTWRDKYNAGLRACLRERRSNKIKKRAWF